MMERLINAIFKLIFPNYRVYEKYALIVVRNKLKRKLKGKIKNKFLFILSPPYCGSTLLNELISTSPNVSENNKFGTREGQVLPTVREIMFNEETRWDKNVDFDWEFIRKEWLNYWDITKPILLEKSPPNIMRANSINKAFPNSFFIIFHRNPYCQCESLINRNGYSAQRAAKFAVKTLQFQKENIDNLKNAIIVSYEELTDDPNSFTQKMKNVMPELEGITTEIEFQAHNFKGRPLKIKNLNKEKIGKLTQAQLDDINVEFKKNESLLKFFNYDLIESSLNKIN